MKRAIIVAALTVGGCTNMGVSGNVPLEEAEHRTPFDLVAAVHAAPTDAGQEIVVGGKLWVPWGHGASVDDDGLRPVGSVHGTTVYARSWDRPPYEALFARHDGHWQGYAPVARSGGEAAH